VDASKGSVVLGLLEGCAELLLVGAGVEMDEMSEHTIEVLGKRFLKCQEENCEWNIGWLGGNDWTEKPCKGTRICNLGVKAIIETETVPPGECPQPSTVLELARAEFQF
jgi:hypothetical protein